MKTIKNKVFILLFNLCLILMGGMAAHGAPADQNFDSAGLGDKGTQSYTLDGVTYTTNDSGGLNINIVNDGNIAIGGDLALGYRSSGVYNTTQVTFRSSDGSEFKLNSFVISTGLGDATVTIKGYRDNTEVASSSITTASFATFDISGNANWQNIDEVKMTGADLDIDIDDIDFSPAVLPTYSVTYNGNGNTGGSVPTDGNTYHITETVTVLGNTGSLVKTGYTFTGWNTAANGSGTSYSGGDTFAMGSSNVTLYARWTAIDYTVTYDGNTNTGGTVPTDGNTYNITNMVTVLGNTGSLVKTGYTFGGWNTAADGSGTSYNGGDTFAMGSSDVTLYARWMETPPIFSKNFSPETILSGGTSTLTFTIDNTASALAATGLAFTDKLPAGLAVATPPNTSATCAGGSLTATAGSSTITYSGGSVPAGASCTIKVDVTSGTVGTYVNTTGDLTSSSGNSGTATASLTVGDEPATIPTLNEFGMLLLFLLTIATGFVFIYRRHA